MALGPVRPHVSSVVLEVGVPADEFELGSVLSAPASVRVELERVVSLGGADALSFWASGRRRERFADDVRDDPHVATLREQADCEDRTLYRLEWTERPEEFVGAVRATGGSVVRARLDGDWLFRLRFPDHDRLSTFYERCVERDVPLRVERIDPDHEAVDPPDRFGLSTAQQEALVLALERGYFATPSEVSLSELAEEFDISHQALSSRIRRGLARILPEVLFSEGHEEAARAPRAPRE